MRHGYLYSKQHLFAKAWKNYMKLEMINIPQNIEIILLIIISVVWLTNFLSGIWNLINPWWWVEQLLLSVKRCENSCKDVLHIDDRSLPTCGKRMEKLLSEWFSGHFSYTALAGCPKERNYTLHSIRGSCSCCNQISTEKDLFEETFGCMVQVWILIEHNYDNKAAKLLCNSMTYGRIPGQFFLSCHYFLQVATS